MTETGFDLPPKAGDSSKCQHCGQWIAYSKHTGQWHTVSGSMFCKRYLYHLPKRG